MKDCKKFVIGSFKFISSHIKYHKTSFDFSHGIKKTVPEGSAIIPRRRTLKSSYATNFEATSFVWCMDARHRREFVNFRTIYTCTDKRGKQRWEPHKLRSINRLNKKGFCTNFLHGNAFKLLLFVGLIELTQHWRMTFAGVKKPWFVFRNTVVF